MRHSPTPPDFQLRNCDIGNADPGWFSIHVCTRKQARDLGRPELQFGIHIAKWPSDGAMHWMVSTSADGTYQGHAPHRQVQLCPDFDTARRVALDHAAQLWRDRVAPHLPRPRRRQAPRAAA